MVVTDSIEATAEMKTCPNIRSITIAPLIGEAMRRINNEATRVESVRLGGLARKSGLPVFRAAPEAPIK